MVYISFVVLAHTVDRIPIVQTVNHPETDCRRYGRRGSGFSIKIFNRSPLFPRLVCYIYHNTAPLSFCYSYFICAAQKDRPSSTQSEYLWSPRRTRILRRLFLLLLLLPYSPFFTLTVWLSFMFYGLWSNEGSWLWDYVTQLRMPDV